MGYKHDVLIERYTKVMFKENGYVPTQPEVFIREIDKSSIEEVSMGKHETVEVTFTLPNGFFNDEKGYDDIYLVPSFIVKEDGKIQMINLSLTHYPADPALTPLQKAE